MINRVKIYVVTKFAQVKELTDNSIHRAQSFARHSAWLATHSALSGPPSLQNVEKAFI